MSYFKLIIATTALALAGCASFPISNPKDTGEREMSPDDNYRVGQSYYHGKNGGKDMDAARYWFHRAARHGHVHAQFSMGVIASTDTNVDYTEAHYWFLKAAEQGHAESQSNLGVIYTYGLGIESDE